MFTIRKAQERGGGHYGWLNTRYTFSFGNYYDPNQMGFRALRVMNEDWVAPEGGFDTHPHRDMEIVTYVLEGALEHKDSLGHGAVLYPGEVQRITAGTGIFHSEFNPSSSDPVHLYQIWLKPDRVGHQPHYDQKKFPIEGRQGRWQTIISPDGRDESLPIQQNSTIHLAKLGSGESIQYPFEPNRYGWLQVLRGEVKLGSSVLREGDGVAISNEPTLQLESNLASEVMLFDLP
jgi:quercetin 2,3-dioxygenase